MKVRHPMGVLHSFSIKNIFYVKMDLRLFYFDVAKLRNLFSLLYKNCCKNDAKKNQWMFLLTLVKKEEL